jgi:hypothetical protein
MLPLDFCQTIATLEGWEPLSSIEYNKRCLRLLSISLLVDEKTLRRWNVLMENDKTPRKYKNYLRAIAALKQVERTLQDLECDRPSLQSAYNKIS